MSTFPRRFSSSYSLAHLWPLHHRKFALYGEHFILLGWFYCQSICLWKLKANTQTKEGRIWLTHKNVKRNTFRQRSSVFGMLRGTGGSVRSSTHTYTFEKQINKHNRGKDGSQKRTVNRSTVSWRLWWQLRAETPAPSNAIKSTFPLG